MRFELHPELLQTLVGNEIYSDPLTFLREAVQNAVDACNLRAAEESGSYCREVVVSYSSSARTVEVRDNGLGMDETALEKGFASVGAPKTELDHVAQLLEKDPELAAHQIGRFGLGVLSYFMAGSTVVVQSRRKASPPIQYRLESPGMDFSEETADADLPVGTSVTVFLKPEINVAAVPDSLRRFARHVPGLRLRDADTGASEVVYTPYADGADGGPTRSLSHPMLVGGSIGLHPSLTEDRGTGAQVAKAQAIVCNGGFLVKEHLPALLPTPCFGYLADIDLRPGALRVFLDREDVRQDDAFRELSRYLVSEWLKVMEAWTRSARSRPAAFAMDVHLVNHMLNQGGTVPPTLGAALGSLKEAAAESATFSVGDRQRVGAADLVALVDDGVGRGLPRALFVDDEAQGTQQQKQITYESSRLVLTDNVSFGRDYRRRRLRAKGYVVVTTRRQQYTVEREQGTVSFIVTETPLLQRVANPSSIAVRTLSQATDEDLSVGGGDRAEFVQALVELDGLRLVHLPALRDGFAGDYDGRLLNLANADSRALLQAWPRLQTNPVLRELFHVYIDMATFRIKSAEDRLRALLLDDALADHLQVEVGSLQRVFLTRVIEDLISEIGGEAPAGGSL